MDPGFTYEINYLDEEYQKYLKTLNLENRELASFYDGFRLAQGSLVMEEGQWEAFRLLHHYRHFGYLSADINPLTLPQTDPLLAIKPGISPETEVKGLPLFDSTVSLLTFTEKLKKIYLGTVGYDFIHADKPVIDFITQTLETPSPSSPLLEPLDIYQKLAQGALFEKFLHSRFPGQKRFSLEGLETALVFLEEIVMGLEKRGYQKAFLGMAHRGRLNILAHLFKKPYPSIFEEFSQENQHYEGEGLGDVKYHKGASTITPSGLELTLASNPSHLESVDPVVLGMSYGAKVYENKKSLPILIHGDASFAGQGIVYETLQMNKIKGFETEGCLHLILNNQIGFTATPEESRSTLMASDIAKAFKIPVFHVHCEDVSALQQIAALSLDLIEKFKIDIIIDLIGYRKWGHNESDEPTFTQPLLYRNLKDKPDALTLYKQKLLDAFPQLQKDVETLEQTLQAQLQEAFSKPPIHEKKPLDVSSPPLYTPSFSDIRQAGLTYTTLPATLNIHPKIKKLYDERHQALQENRTLDWASAELLAFATLLQGSYNLRLVGQDSQRGTFSQRHAILVDQQNETHYNVFTPLITASQHCEILNSYLSEFAVMGFEYGLSKTNPKTLCLWEAQFGDFANSAQVIIDQYIVSSKTKWNETSNLVLMLPHGYEGQGPEHTSARIERYLELAADENIQLCIPTTPIQLFNLLLDQVSKQTPLILFTPKGLLRHPLAQSPFQDFGKVKFNPILDDGNLEATLIVLCYGRIYFDLLERKKEKNLAHISLVRLEQLYPLDKTSLEQTVRARKNFVKLVLVQDEPLNMGAYYRLKAEFIHLEVIARNPASSPATGLYGLHKKEQQRLLTEFENL